MQLLGLKTTISVKIIHTFESLIPKYLPVHLVRPRCLGDPDAHESITTDAFSLSVTSLKPEIKDTEAILKKILNGNVRQDKRNGSLHDRHFLTGNETFYNMRIEMADNYGKYLKEEVNNFEGFLETPSCNKCLLAIESLGLLSHSWQDYYGHGISFTVKYRRVYDMGRVVGESYYSEGSYSVDGPIGNPYDRTFLPASWSITGSPIKPPPEYHPGMGVEPIQRLSQSSFEYNKRVEAAKQFTADNFKSYLKFWAIKCACFENEMIKPELD